MTHAISEIAPIRTPLAPDELRRTDAYWRAANYLSVGQIYATRIARSEIKI